MKLPGHTKTNLAFGVLALLDYEFCVILWQSHEAQIAAEHDDLLPSTMTLDSHHENPSCR